MPRVLISGASGLVGSALVPYLENRGWTVLKLVRPGSPPGGDNQILWDPMNHSLETQKLENLDAVIHLAGESIADGRWTAAKKERIRKSRVEVTRFLAEALGRLKNPPKTFISASAIGFYGDRGPASQSETSPAGSSFLARVCQEWEAAAEPLSKKGVRVVFIRTGIVLSAKGGALGKMLLPFKMGVGGKIGSGDQYMSWIDIDDEVGVIEHALKTESLVGPVNAVAPAPVPNGDFTKALGRALNRPTLFPMPAFAAKLAFGEMADELLLSSLRVEPAQLRQSGYAFRYPQLDESLRHLLKN
jgi:uncharacterized protein (TIGR01777 family)